MVGKRKNNQYFYDIHEEAIVEYIESNDKAKRDKLYEEIIEPVFDELVDKIVYTYKFTTLPNIDSLRKDCKVWLVTIIEKFDPYKGSRAFTYFSVVTKNWFIAKVKKTAKQQKREVYFEDIKKDIEMMELSVENEYLSKRERYEYVQYLKREITRWRTLRVRDSERKVIEAIEELLGKVDEIEIFNKKAIYLYIRELTGLNTKQIAGSLQRIRTKYKEAKTRWEVKT